MKPLQLLFTCCLLLVSILLSSCGRSDTDRSGGKVSASEIAGIFKKAIQAIPEGASFEEWQATLDKAVPVETYATNSFQPKLGSTKAEDLRLPERTHLKIGMPWFINGEVAPFFVAMEKGYYDAVNLDIEIVPGGPGIDHSLTLLSGKVDIALIADSLRLFNIITSETGAELSTIGALYPSLPLAFLGLDANTPQSEVSSNPASVADVSGSYIGVLPGFDDYLDYLDAKYQPEYRFDQRMRIGGSTSPVMAGKIDWAMGWISFQAREMEREGFQNWRAVFYRDIGFDIPADIIIAKTSDLTSKAPEIRAFLWATAMGKAYQIDNYAEAARITNERQPTENVVSDAYLIRRFELEAPTFNPPPGSEPLEMDLGNWSYAFAQLAYTGVLK